MNFKIVENGEELECKIILTFTDESNNIHYIVYTDGTRNEKGKLETYASRYILENGNYVLKDIENDYEWNLIDNMLKSKEKEMDD